MKGGFFGFVALCVGRKLCVVVYSAKLSVVAEMPGAEVKGESDGGGGGVGELTSSSLKCAGM